MSKKLPLLLALPVLSVWLTGCGSSPPTAADVASVIGEKVENLQCTAATDSKGGYVCTFISQSSGIFGGGGRFVKEGGSWRGSPN